MSLYAAMFLGWFVVALLMVCLWRWQCVTGRSSVVDVAWSLSVAGLSAWFASQSPQGNAARRGLLVLLICGWAARLAFHLLARIRRLPEDGRYEQLRASWGDEAPRRMFGFFQFQAIGAFLFALPVLLASRNPRPLGATDLIGLAIFLTAMLGESLADWQLARFRQDTDSKGGVCDSGLWRYSRHPNYFFEWLHWWSYVPFAAGGPGWWLTVLGPLAMLFFILRVTGIPPTEAQALRSRGEAYRDYQRRTSPFFPWFPSHSEPGTRNPALGVKSDE